MATKDLAESHLLQSHLFQRCHAHGATQFLNATGQHLLSAVVDEVVGADTLSWEMHPFREDAEPASNTACIDLPTPLLNTQQLQVCMFHEP